jgi:Flp pilus assembly secretin CpaC
MRHSIVAALAFGLVSSQAFAAGMTVPMDEVRTLTFGKPIATVYVGNSVIADVNMVDSRHAFVLGKAFGTTNVIALDSTGRQVANVYITVHETRGATVTLLKGSAQMTLSCGGPRCEVSPIPGDAKYGADLGDVAAHHDLGMKTASTGAAGGGTTTPQ